MTVKTHTAQYDQVWDSVEGLEQTSVIRLHPVADNERIPHGLKIMVIDAYSYQREFSVSRHQHYEHGVPVEIGTMTTQREGEYQPGVPFEPITGVPIMGEQMVDRGLQWVVSAYKHPFRPAVETVVSEKVAMRLIDRIWKLATEYPILMFNNAEVARDRRRASAEGFVHFHDQLLAGATPSVKLLP